MRIFSFLIVALTACQHAAPVHRGPPVGIQVFSRHPQFIEAKISPGGSYLAAVRLDGGKRSLVFIDLRTSKLASAFTPAPESVGDVHWVNDTRAVVELLDEAGSLAAPVGTGEIYSVDPKTGKGLMIFGYRAGRNMEYAYGGVLARLPHDEKHFLAYASGFLDAGDHVFTVYKIDAYTGHKTMVTASPSPGAGFLTDENGEPRIFIGQTLDVKDRIYYRDPGGPWTEPTSLKGLKPHSRPVGFDSQTHTLHVVEPMEKGFGLVSIHVDDGERKLLSRNDWVPPRRYLEDQRTLQVLAVEYEPDVPSWDVLVPDHPLSRVLKGLLGAYPDDNVRIVSTTDDLKKAIAFVYSDRNPGRFLLVDVESMQAEEVAAVRPWIKPGDMFETSAFHIPASDGLWIHGYLTMPKPGDKPPPLVVIPHGGPHGPRDVWSFDSEAQLLAKEGFAVLKVNFRGSGGYGLKFQEAGYRHWGDRIMQDIIDATRYVIRKGNADPQRICIYGGSFGGYSALQAPILAPDLFRCAVGYSGIYDLTIMSSDGDIGQSRMGRGFLERVLGDDEEQLKRFSPVFNVDKLRAKVLLIHGKKDERAPFKHAERLRAALQEHGIEPEWLVEPREAHGFYDEDARERMYLKLVLFLHENTR